MSKKFDPLNLLAGQPALPSIRTVKRLARAEDGSTQVLEFDALADARREEAINRLSVACPKMPRGAAAQEAWRADLAAFKAQNPVPRVEPVAVWDLGQCDAAKVLPWLRGKREPLNAVDIEQLKAHATGLADFDLPHHYIERISPAIESGAAWWASALARCNSLSESDRLAARQILSAAIKREWKTGCDRDMCLWEEDMPPVVITATPAPGFFLFSCMEQIAAALKHDLVWRNRAHIEMSISVERVRLRVDGCESLLWTPQSKS